MYHNNGYIVIAPVNGSNEFLLVDPETGIVRDICYWSYCGAYCYYNLQTEWATDLGTSLGSYGSSIMNIFNGNGMVDFSQIASNIRVGFVGLMSSTMTSLQWANMFLMDNIPSNLLSTFAGLNVIGLAVNNVYMGSKIEEEDYTTVYGSNYTLEKNENSLTLEEAQIIVQTYPNAFEYDAWESLQEALKDDNQRAGLLITGGFALCTIGFVRPGADFIVDGFLMCFDAESPPPDTVSYVRICP